MPGKDFWKAVCRICGVEEDSKCSLCQYPPKVLSLPLFSQLRESLHQRYVWQGYYQPTHNFILLHPYCSHLRLKLFSERKKKKMKGILILAPLQSGGQHNTLPPKQSKRPTTRFQVPQALKPKSWSNNTKVSPYHISLQHYLHPDSPQLPFDSFEVFMEACCRFLSIITLLSKWFRIQRRTSNNR